MRTAIIVSSAAALVLGALTTTGCAPTLRIPESAPGTASYSPRGSTPPTVQLLDCEGTTGWHGCGPGWFWRDGWHGLGCYRC
jgi:hypothetical protein